MKKVTTLLTLSVLFGMLLASCSSGTNINTTGTPGTPMGSNLTETPGVPGTGDETTTPPAEMLDTTPTIESDSTLDASPTLEATEELSSTSMPTSGTNNNLLSNQMNFKVVDQENQTIGEIKDFVLDFSTQMVTYAIVTTSGDSANVAGDIAIPWNLLRLEEAMESTDSSNSSSTDSKATETTTPADLTPEATLENDTSSADSTQGVLVFSGDSTMLSSAPVFMASELPALGTMSSDWDSTHSNFWKDGAANSNTPAETATPDVNQTLEATSTTAAGQTMAVVPNQGVILGSKLIGHKVMDDNNTEIAEVSDAVVDFSTGMITYVIVTVDDQLIPVPLSALGWDSNNQAMVGVGGSTVLQGAPSFDLNSLPEMGMSDWDAQLKTYWQPLLSIVP